MPLKQDVLLKMIGKSEETYMVYDITNGRFLYANSSFETITHRTCQQLLNNPGSMLEAIHPDDQKLAVKIFKTLLRKTTCTALDFRIIRPDRTERWIRMKTYPISENKQITYLTCFMEDDTARKSSLLNMQKVNGWKDSILEIMAHDLRGPISLVKTLANAIDQKLQGKENREILKWTKMIQEISSRNIRLIHNLVKKESLDTAGAEINKERMELVREIGEVMNIFISSQVHTRRKIEFTRSHKEIYAEVDSMKLLQIINNLISNAIKFTRPDGSIKLHLEKLERSALITVLDNGIGIPRSLQPVIFNKYTEAGRTGIDGQESVGLGMWIVKKFAEAQGGTVWLESEEEKGTKVYVEIPLGIEMYD
jgi:two-component system, OmpR family, sensor histidine kinase VicK